MPMRCGLIYTTKFNYFYLFIKSGSRIINLENLDEINLAEEEYIKVIRFNYFT